MIVPLSQDIPDCEVAGPEFAPRRVDFSVVIGPRGEFVGIEDMAAGRASRRASILAPASRRHSRERIANFLCDKTGYALGVRADPQARPGFGLDPRAFACFRQLHEQVLEGVVDTAVTAFLRFLDHWEPEQFLDVPHFQDRLDQTLAFRFQYDDELLHERHAARLAWKRFLAGEDSRPAEPQYL